MSLRGLLTGYRIVDASRADLANPTAVHNIACRPAYDVVITIDNTFSNYRIQDSAASEIAFRTCPRIITHFCRYESVLAEFLRARDL